MIRRARSRGLPTTPIAAALLTVLLFGVTSAHGGPLTVAWDPSPDPSVIGYRVYVGTTAGVYTETHDVGNVTTFAYNAVEGATYYFAVASYAAGLLVGPRSSEVSASTAGAPLPPTGTPSPATGTPSTPGEAGSFWSSLWSAKATSSRAASPDGRQFFVEGGRRVRLMTERGVARESVLVSGNRAITLSQVAIDPTFAETGFIWVAETSLVKSGRMFTVARYRVVGNRAGERVASVSGILLPPTGNALFAVGRSGQVYVAVPGLAGGANPYWGKVLRFNPDGSVPNDNQPGSPVIGMGYTFPHAIALDPSTERVFVTGVDP